MRVSSLADRERRIDVDVQRHRRARGALEEREPLDHLRRQHRDLVAGHVGGREPLARDRVDRRAGREAERRRGDVHAHAHRAVRAARDRERVVDLGGGRVVEAERRHVRERKIGRQLRRGHVRKPGAAREMLEEKPPEVIVVARPERAAALGEPRGREAERLARLLERLGLDAVAVGLVEELREDRAQLVGHLRALERLRPARDSLALLALALEAGERRLQGFRRRGLEAPLALAMEVHRRRVQLEEDARRLDRCRRVAVVLGGEVGESELRLAARLPQEIDVDLRRRVLGPLEEVGDPRLAEPQQDVGALHLAALAVRRLDLQRSVVLREHGADLEGAVVLVQDVHGRARSSCARADRGDGDYSGARPANSRIAGRCSGKLFSV